MNAVHPIFDCVLDSIAPPAPSKAERMKAYLQALRDFDWSYDRSDDFRVWQRGQEALERLRVVQRDLDADGVLWNVYCEIPEKRVYATVQCGIAQPAGIDEFQQPYAESLAGDLSLAPIERELNTREGSTFATPSRRATA